MSLNGMVRYWRRLLVTRFSSWGELHNPMGKPTIVVCSLIRCEAVLPKEFLSPTRLMMNALETYLLSHYFLGPIILCHFGKKMRSSSRVYLLHLQRLEEKVPSATFHIYIPLRYYSGCASFRLSEIIFLPGCWEKWWGATRRDELISPIADDDSLAPHP